MLQRSTPRMIASFEQKAPIQNLFERVSAQCSSPFILSIGGGPLGKPAPPSTSSFALPVFRENFYDLSNFEKDSVVRLCDFLCSKLRMQPSPEFKAVINAQCGSPKALASSDTVSLGTAPWQPFFDVIVLPDGSAFFGWCRNHALDDVWVRHTASYVDDLWRRAPKQLYSMQRAAVYDGTYPLVQNRGRHLHIFDPALTVTAGDMEENYQQILRLSHGTLRKDMPLEDRVLLLYWHKRSSSTDAARVMELLKERDEALSTGTATALLRHLVTTYASYSHTARSTVKEEVRAAAAHVCELTRDSSVSFLFRCAATLLSEAGTAATSTGTSTASAKNKLPSSAQCDDFSYALVLSLRAVLNPSAEQRRASLCDMINNFIFPFCTSLLAEEAFLTDTFRVSHRELDNAHDKKAAAAFLALKATTQGTHGSVDERFTLTESEDMSFFSSVLQRGGLTEAEEGAAFVPAEQPCRSAAAGSMTWLPGAGMDVRGCWCVAFTLCNFLLTHLKLQPHRGHDTRLAASIKKATEAEQVFRVNFIRRSSYVTPHENLWSLYSLLSHMAAMDVPCAAGLTLLHLTHEGEGAARPSNSFDTTSLLGFLFLFPKVEVRSYFGGSVSQFCTALSSGTRSIPCYQDPLTQPAAKRVHVQTLSMPGRFSKPLLRQLKGREAAVLCVVQSGFAIKDVFPVEELSSHLHHLVLE